MKLIKVHSGEELKAIRKKYKITQPKLAEIMGMSAKSVTLIYKYELGKGDLTNYRHWEKLEKWEKDHLMTRILVNFVK